MKTVKKGDPAPYDGYIITKKEYSEIINDKKILYWVSNQLKKLNL